MTKTVDTLVEDVQSLFGPSHTELKNTEALDQCLDSIRGALKTAIAESGVPRKFVLRASNIGSPDRKLWLQSRDPEYGVHSATTHMIFLMGHVLEAILLFLIKEAGHEVTDEQKTIIKHGVEGHMDCRIDGILLDAKTASSSNYKKFVTNSVAQDDEYGYLYQLAFYADDDDKELGWLAIDKQLGKFCVALVNEMTLPNVEERIRHIRKMLASDTMPEPCGPLRPQSNGNIELPTVCSFCPYRQKCWPTARAFKYSNQIRRFIHVEKEPDARVKEITTEA